MPRDSVESLPRDLLCLELFQEEIKEFQILLYRTVTSTNTLARELLTKGLGHLTVVIADAQTGGRGRCGRQWFSPSGVNIYMSVIVQKPHCAYNLLPLATANAIFNAVGYVAPQVVPDLWIKWPNDLFVKDKKLSGILIETINSAFTVIGMGINVNMDRTQIPAELQNRVCSLYTVTGKRFSRAELIVAVLKMLRQAISSDSHIILQQWTKNSRTPGSRVKAILADKVIEGVAECINPDGSLTVRTDRGEHIVLHSADIIHLR